MKERTLVSKDERAAKKNPRVIELERRIQVKHNEVREELADCGNADTAAV